MNRIHLIGHMLLGLLLSIQGWRYAKRHVQCINPYHHFKDHAVHTQNFSFLPNPFGFIYFSNPFIVNIANWFYLASGHIDVVHHYSPDHQIAGTMLDANGNEIQNISQIPQERYINACASPSLLQDNDELASGIEDASTGGRKGNRINHSRFHSRGWQH